MAEITRRDHLKGTRAAMAGAMLPSHALAVAPEAAPPDPPPGKGRIVLCELTGPGRLATTMLRMGLTHVIAGLRLRGSVDEQAAQVAETKKAYEAAGLTNR
jgi:hypothetical protein